MEDKLMINNENKTLNPLNKQKIIMFMNLSSSSINNFVHN